MPDNAPVDLSTLEEYTDGDPEAMQELIEAFYETAEEGLKALSENNIDGESEVWSAAAHKLKGAAGYVGAERLKELCGTAQNMHISNPNERTQILDQITQQYRIVCCFLEEQSK